MQALTAAPVLINCAPAAAAAQVSLTAPDKAQPLQLDVEPLIFKLFQLQQPLFCRPTKNYFNLHTTGSRCPLL